MNNLEAIKLRKSVRQFEDAVVKEEYIQNLKSQIERLTVLNCEKPLKWEISRGKGGTFNLFLNNPERNPDNLTEFGFEGQQLVIFLTGLGLGTLWHVMNGEKSSPCTITFGYEVKDAKKGLMQKMISGVTKPGQRKNLDELLKLKTGSIDSKIMEVLEYSRLAPSAMNRQPWEFVQEGNFEISFRLTSWKKEYNYIDLGILLGNSAIAADYKGLKYEIEKENDNSYKMVFESL